MDRDHIRELVRQQYAISAELTAATGRPFTPDGHAVGSTGEVLASIRFGLQLVPPSNEGFDALKGDLKVEIKATAGPRGIAVRGRTPIADHLLVLQLDDQGHETVIFNGPASPVWEAIGHKAMQKNGQRFVSLATLRRLQKEVAAHQMLEEI